MCQQILGQSTDFEENFIDFFFGVAFIGIDGVYGLGVSSVHFSEEEGRGFFEMRHVLLLDAIEFVFFVDVVEVGAAEHAEEEVEVHHGDRDVGGRGGVLAVRLLGDCEEFAVLGGGLVD
jgi:hypothetical protein